MDYIEDELQPCKEALRQQLLALIEEARGYEPEEYDCE